MSCCSPSIDSNRMRAPSGDHLGYAAASVVGLSWRSPLPSASTSQIASSLGGIGTAAVLLAGPEVDDLGPIGGPAGSRTRVGTGRAQFDDPTAREVHRGDRREVGMRGRILGLPDEGEARAVTREGQLRVAQAGSGAAGVHGLGAAAARIDQVELSFVEVEEARPVGRPDRRGLVGVPIGDDLVGAAARPFRPRRVGSSCMARRRRNRCGPCRRAEGRRSNRPAGCSGSAPASRRSGDPLGTTTATFGAGVTAGRGLMIPEPAARTPPTIRTAATASNVKPRRPPRARSGTGVVAGIVARTWRRSSGAVSVSPTSAAYQAWRRCSSSWSVMGSSPCRPHRWRRATASVRSGDGTGRSRTGCRAAVAMSSTVRSR